METKGKNKGFTIIELLTVMGIIAILIGLLVPALNLVKDFSKQIQQKAQFHSIDVALEMFKNDFGTYPESSDNVDVYTGISRHPVIYCGANKLAEALVGLDYLGFHPNSDLRATGHNTVILKDNTSADRQVYHAYDDTQADWQTAEENLKARKGPFIEFENANAYRMDEVYTNAALGTVGFANAYSLPAGMQYPLVLCDVFAKKRLGTGGKKTGMPVLYYRARTMYSEQRYNSAATATLPGNILDDIYYYPDNENLLALGTPEDSVVLHPLRNEGGSAGLTNDVVDFENMILNKQVTTIKRPYRAGSFILISAGKDGLYGTADDIFNFTKETEQ
jgi:prepilin-type N-terminal cleavage/methylation domain-containing protein